MRLEPPIWSCVDLFKVLHDSGCRFHQRRFPDGRVVRRFQIVLAEAWHRVFPIHVSVKVARAIGAGHFCSSIRRCRVMNAWINASGAGGQPGIWTSTGIYRSMPLSTL